MRFNYISTDKDKEDKYLIQIYAWDKFSGSFFIANFCKENEECAHVKPIPLRLNMVF